MANFIHTKLRYVNIPVKYHDVSLGNTKVFKNLPVNLDHVLFIDEVDETGIRFHLVGDFALSWHFENKQQRDAVFADILREFSSSMTTL